MQPFTIIESEFVVLVGKGIFRQKPVYQRGPELFAAWAGGFIGLRQRGSTTLPHIRWIGLSLPAQQYDEPSIGNLVLVADETRLAS